MNPDATFAALGIDSLSMIELAIMVEDQCGIKIEGIDAESTLAQAVALPGGNRRTAASQHRRRRADGNHSVSRSEAAVTGVGPVSPAGTGASDRGLTAT